MADVVVNDVEEDGETLAMRLIDETSQRMGRPIVRFRREESRWVVAPRPFHREFLNR